MTAGDSTPSPEQWGDLRAVIAQRGVLINIATPFFLLAVGYALRRLAGLGAEPAFDEETQKLFAYILGAVAIGELAAGFFIRRSSLKPSRFDSSTISFAAFAQQCVKVLTVVFILGAFPAMYGLILYAFGGAIEQFIFFILISLVGYRFLRPNLDDLQKLWTDITGGPLDEIS